jgi:valyl-tRNA synthetase
MTDLPKTFDPAAIETRWYAHWEENGLFRPHRPEAQPFTIVNPPPNVTGSLHIGHALDNTLQDIVIRYERLRGKDALWVVGTDHAGIATQMVVERNLASQGIKRTDMSREAFVEHVWEWKGQSGGTITRQLRRLGCSMDWSREQFTMDPHFSRAVTKVFVDLYNEGLLYRDKRLVNWDPGLRTAISDLEVETREVQGSFWHFRYPLADGVTLSDGRDHIVVATTRPETMLADMAVAVHPEDERYASVVGKEVILPITGRRIQIVPDAHADPALGTGAVKITPGHDFNDFDVGRRAGIAASAMLNMFDADAKVVQCGGIPEDLLGLDRFEARKAVVARLKADGFLVPHIDKDGVAHDAEPRTIQTPYGDRSGAVIEPWLTDQWYVDAATLAKPAIEAVRSGAIEIVPKSWEKTFFNWMENIQPWCVSRQLWWGHRIPAWYGPKKTPGGISLTLGETALGSELRDEHVFVAVDEASVVDQALAYYHGYATRDEIKFYDTPDEAFEAQLKAFQEQRNEIALFREGDVLDTWFSSALWPFATLGWPGAEKPSPLQGRGLGEGADHNVVHAAALPLRPAPSREREGGLVARHYPSDLLISGFDILFFWDARMMMQGLHFMKDVPFRRLYLHGLVRAADGQKMSKSKGNVVDPLGLIDRYGADALRFFMAAMESQGRDVKMDEKRVEGYRNFATKLWNAARFAQANGIGASPSVAAPAATLAVNRWIIGEVVETLGLLDKAMADLRFDAAANAIYHFVWDRFCDWYLELVKPVLSNVEDKPSPLQGRGLGEGTSEANSTPDHALPPTSSREREGEQEETRAVAGWVLDQILVMLHPFMPFITEELWHALGEREHELIVAAWPQPEAPVDAGAKAEVEWLIGVVRDVRSARAEVNVPPSEKLMLGVRDATDQVHRWMKSNHDVVKRLARLSMITADPVPTEGSLVISQANATFLLPVAGQIDLDAERARLAKAQAAAEKDAASLAARLGNPAFVEKARPEAVEKARADHAEKAAEAGRLKAALARLG